MRRQCAALLVLGALAGQLGARSRGDRGAPPAPTSDEHERSCGEHFWSMHHVQFALSNATGSPRVAGPGRQSIRALQPFIILFGGQTGTTHLGRDWLQQHPKVFWVPEGWMEWGRMRYGDDCLSQLLNATLRVRNGIASIGTKSQRLDALSSLPHNARVVHITRRNTLKWALSLYNKERWERHLGHWQCRGYDNCTYPAPPERVDVAMLDDRLRMKVALEKKRAAAIAASGRSVLSLHYEDFIVDPEEYVAKVFQHVGVSRWIPRYLRGRSQGREAKATADSLREAVSNYGEIERKYRGTDFAEWLEDS